MITLTNFKRDKTASGIRLNCTANIDGKNELVFFDIEGPEQKLAKITPDPSSFLIGMLIAAMDRGEDLHIDGNIPATFLHHVNAFLVPFLVASWPSRKHIIVTALSEAEWLDKPKGNGAMTGLSCGVDSLYTLMQYTDKNLPDAYQLKSFVVFDVGAFGEHDDKMSDARYEQAKNQAANLTKQIGYDFYSVRSNIRQWQVDDFRRVSTLVNSACALAVADICDTFLLSSSEPYRTISVPGQLSKTKSVDSLDSIILPLIRNNRLDIFSSGAGSDRFTKILSLFERSAYLNRLTTCTRINPEIKNGVNCGTCAKCGQFLLMAEAKNLLDKFSNNFDLPAYHRRKWRICQRITTTAWSSKDAVTAQQTLQFARENGVKFPITALAASYIKCKLHRVAPKYF